MPVAYIVISGELQEGLGRCMRQPPASPPHSQTTCNKPLAMTGYNSDSLVKLQPQPRPHPPRHPRVTSLKVIRFSVLMSSRALRLLPDIRRTLRSAAPGTRGHHATLFHSRRFPFQLHSPTPHDFLKRKTNHILRSFPPVPRVLAPFSSPPS